MSTSVPQIIWKPYKKSLVSQIALPSATDTTWFVPIRAVYQNKPIWADGVIIDNTNNNGAVTVLFGPFSSTVPPFSRDYLELHENTGDQIEFVLSAGTVQLFFYVGEPPIVPQSYNFLGAATAAQASAPVPQLQTQPIFSSTTFITPGGTSIETVFRFTLVGGGGSGAGGNGASSIGNGGGGGGCAIYEVSGLQPGTSIPVTIGAGGQGAGGPGTGNAGGTSSIVVNGTTVSASGGQPGQLGASGPGGAGGFGTNGTINAGGDAGANGGGTQGGKGGASYLGGGGQGGDSGPGFAGQNFGGGGGGAANATTAGASGAPGIVIVEWIQ